MSNLALESVARIRFEEIADEHFNQVMEEVIESHYGYSFQRICEVVSDSDEVLAAHVQEAVYDEHRAEVTCLVEDIAKEILIEELEDLIRGL